MLKNIAIIGLLALGAVSSATVTGTSNTNPTCFTGVNGNLPNIRLSNGNRTISWGSKGDCLYFTPTSFQSALNTPFKAGKLCWTNCKSRYEPAGSFTTRLQVGLNFTQPAGVGTKIVTFDINYNQGAGYNADTLSVPTAIPQQVFTVGDTVYTLKFAGFKRSGAGAGSSTVSSVNIEGTQSCLDMYFELDAQPVPEPATLAVLGIGAAAVLRRRAKK